MPSRSRPLIACGLLFGLLPAFRHGGPRVWSALRGGGRTATGSRERHRARSVLVVTQVALALVLLVSSGLMIRTSFALRSVEPGFTEPASIQTVRISIPGPLVADPERVARLQNDVVDGLSALPGVTSVGYANVMHMEGLGTSWDAIQPEGAPPHRHRGPADARVQGRVPEVLRGTGTRFIVGRDYEWADLYGRRPVVIISENLARELWRTPQQAIGKRLRASLPGIAAARGHRRRAGRAGQRRAAIGAGDRLLAGARRQSVSSRRVARWRAP